MLYSESGRSTVVHLFPSKSHRLIYSINMFIIVNLLIGFVVLLQKRNFFGKSVSFKRKRSYLSPILKVPVSSEIHMV